MAKARKVQRCRHCGRVLPPESENLLEMALESQPARWAAQQLVKAGRPDMTAGEAVDRIEAIFEKALVLARLCAAEGTLS
jgi:hypothetical protein